MLSQHIKNIRNWLFLLLQRKRKALPETSICSTPVTLRKHQAAPLHVEADKPVFLDQASQFRKVSLSYDLPHVHDGNAIA